jgi:DNA-binding Lrp family transcriptional regulator
VPIWAGGRPTPTRPALWSRRLLADCSTALSVRYTCLPDEEATILRSYVLIQTVTGRATDVTGAIRGEPGVISAETVTGPYDVVVLVEAENIDAVGHLVVTAIQPVEGIVRTLTCPVVNL